MWDQVQLSWTVCPNYWAKIIQVIYSWERVNLYRSNYWCSFWDAKCLERAFLWNASSEESENVVSELVLNLCKSFVELCRSFHIRMIKWDISLDRKLCSASLWKCRCHKQGLPASFRYGSFHLLRRGYSLFTDLNSAVKYVYDKLRIDTQ